MNKPNRLYRILYCIAFVLMRPFYWIQIVGRENLPDGAALLCGNHSSWLDPVLIAFAIGRRFQLHMMAKKELFKSRFFATIIWKLGSFSVDRSTTDLQAIKTAMKYLKSGEKVGIFPEGTRCAEDGMIEAKRGAIKIADKVHVPIVPIFIPRKKRIFQKIQVVIGEPLYVNAEGKRLTADEYDVKSAELMQKIYDLGKEVRTI